jgi:hypothetical protein
MKKECQAAQSHDWIRCQICQTAGNGVCGLGMDSHPVDSESLHQRDQGQSSRKTASNLTHRVSAMTSSGVRNAPIPKMKSPIFIA